MFKNNLNIKFQILIILLGSISCDLIIRSPKEIQSQFISKHYKKINIDNIYR